MTRDEPQPSSEVERRLLEAIRLAKEISAEKGPDEPDDDTNREPEVDSETALAAVRIRLEKLKAKNQKQDLRLRKQLARNATRFVAIQLVVSNIFFGMYLGFNVSNPSSQVMIAWLASSVIEVIGILAVIARSLFPVPKEPKEKKDEKDSGSN